MSAAASTLATFNPTPTVSIGAAAADEIVDRVIAITVEESVDGLARCEITLDNWGVVDGGPGYVFADRSTFDFGDPVTVSMGPPDEHERVFSGRVGAFEAVYGTEGGPALVVLADDALQNLRMTRRTRTFEEMTDADICSEIARDHDLGDEIDLDGPTHPVVTQLNESDLAFLRGRVLPTGADVWLDDTTLHVGTRADEPLVLRLGRELLTFQVLADLALQATEQRVAGWDPANKEAVLETADESAITGDIGNGIGGGSLLAERFGDRPATATLPRPTAPAEARTLAEGLYRERARRFVTGTGTADGIAALRAARTVELSGLGAMFDGEYRLTRVVHRFDRDTGYRAEIEVERAGVPR